MVSGDTGNLCATLFPRIKDHRARNKAFRRLEHMGFFLTTIQRVKLLLLKLIMRNKTNKNKHTECGASVSCWPHRLAPSSQGSEGLCDPCVAASSIAGRWWLGPHCIVFRSCLGKAHSARDSFGVGGLRSGRGQAWLRLGP